MSDYEVLPAADGYPLSTRWFVPANPRGAVLIAAAMGVSQTYYEAFARWLTGHGQAVVTFDYRGVGKSRPESLRGFEATVLEWARLDCAAVLGELVTRYPDLAVTWVGHSLGGQIFPFLPNYERVARMITVATGSGYWLENSWKLRSRVWLLWFFLVPLTMRAFGYYPGRRLRKVGDLPYGVMDQWRRWCLNREYAVGVEPGARELFAAVRTPILSLSFTDDDYMSAQNVESIHSFYTNAPREMRRISPESAGVRRIGHFGFFREKHQSVLWEPHVLPQLV